MKTGNNADEAPQLLTIMLQAGKSVMMIAIPVVIILYMFGYFSGERGERRTLEEENHEEDLLCNWFKPQM